MKNTKTPQKILKMFLNNFDDHHVTSKIYLIMFEPPCAKFLFYEPRP